MSSIDDVERIKSQLTIAQWHLEQLATSDSDNHLVEACRAYEIVVNLLPTLEVSGTRRVELVTGLADIKNGLLAVGVEL